MSDLIESAEVPELFERWLAGRPLAERSRREYAQRARTARGSSRRRTRAGWQGESLSDPLARDHAARDYRRYLQVERRAAASTVNLALASLDALYRCLGLGRPNVRREKPAQAAPRALDEAEQRRLLRAAEAAPVRPRALVMLMLFTALRISETVALDVDDVRITARRACSSSWARASCGARCRSTRSCAKFWTSGSSTATRSPRRRARAVGRPDGRAVVGALGRSRRARRRRAGGA